MPKTYKRKLYKLEHETAGLYYIAKLTQNELYSLLKMGYALIDEEFGFSNQSLAEYSYGDLVLLRGAR